MAADPTLNLRGSKLIFPLVNQVNPGLPQPLSENNAFMSDPAAQAEGAARNTKVTVTPNPASRQYSGMVDIHYDRLQFQDILTQNYGGDPVWSWRTMSDQNFVDQLGAAYEGMAFGTDDFTALPDLTSAPLNEDVTLTVADNSTPFLGSASVPVTIFPYEETNSAAQAVHDFLTVTLPSLNL